MWVNDFLRPRAREHVFYIYRRDANPLNDERVSVSLYAIAVYCNRAVYPLCTWVHTLAGEGEKIAVS